MPLSHKLMDDGPPTNWQFYLSYHDPILSKPRSAIKNEAYIFQRFPSLWHGLFPSGEEDGQEGLPIDNLLRNMWEIKLEIVFLAFVFGLSRDPRPCHKIDMIDTFCVGKQATGKWHSTFLVLMQMCRNRNRKELLNVNYKFQYHRYVRKLTKSVLATLHRGGSP